MNCPNCQKDIAAGSKFCYNCGAKQPEVGGASCPSCVQLAQEACALDQRSKNRGCVRRSGGFISISTHSWFGCCGRWRSSARGRGSCSISSSGSPCRRATPECPRHRPQPRPSSHSSWGETFNLSTFEKTLSCSFRFQTAGNRARSFPAPTVASAKQAVSSVKGNSYSCTAK